MIFGIFETIILVHKQKNIILLIGVRKKCYITIWCKIVNIYDSYYHGKKHLVLIRDNLVQDRDKFGAKPEKIQEIFGAKSKQFCPSFQRFGVILVQKQN